MAIIPSRPWYQHWWGILLIIFLLIIGAALGYWFYLFWGYYQRIERGELSSSAFTLAGRFTTSDRLRTAFGATPEDVNLATEDDPQTGRSGAPVTIVEFADFGCPYSREESFIVREIASRYTNKVHYIYRDFPIDELHPRARRAAEAGECAKELGNFWAYHDKLYQNQNRFEEDDLRRYATEIGLDAEAFNTCLVSGRYADEVQADLDAGLKVGIRGTPTFFVNGKRIEGAIPREIWEKILGSLIGS